MSSVDCHYCEQSRQRQGSVLKCCIKKCNRFYCLDCVRKHFNSNFQMTQYRKDSWICYTCQGKCTCEGCKFYENNPGERKGSRRRNNKSNNKHDESAQHSNLSASFNSKMNEMPQIPKIEQSQEVDVVGDYKVHGKMLIPKDEIIMMPFFMQRLAKRKNMYFQFMAKKGTQKSTKNQRIQSMLQQALKSGKYDNDDIDLDDIDILE